MMMTMNTVRCPAFCLACVTIAIVVALPFKCEGSATDTDGCVMCLIMNLLSYNQLLRDPVRLFGALQNQIVYNKLCRAFDYTMHCIDISRCTQDNLDVLNSQYRWPVLRIMLNEICNPDLQSVVPSYCRDCYMHPSVTACISSFWMTHLPQDDEAICRQIEDQVNFNRCIDKSTQSLCESDAVELIRKLSASNQADMVPPGFPASSCSHLTYDDEWNWSDGPRSAPNTLELDARQPSHATTYPEPDVDVRIPVVVDAGTRSAHSFSYVLIIASLIFIFLEKKVVLL